MNALRQCWEFELELEIELAERVEDVGDGITAVLDTRIPLVWDANYLLAESEEVTVQQLVAKADEVLGGLGMEHRSAGTRDPGPSGRIAEGLEKLGWEREDSLHMVLRRKPDHPAAVEVERVELDDVRHVNEAILLEEEWGSKEVAEQIHSRNTRIGGEWSDRWFAARYEGEIASCCRLLQRDGIGQVEDVATLELARGLGLARAVVLEAARTSVKDGDELTFLSALADDWPRELYTRLGFDAVGQVSYARRKPQRGK